MKVELTKFKDQAEWELKKRSHLEDELKEQERNSYHLSEEIVNLKEALKHPFDQYDYDVDDFMPFQKHISREDFAKEKLLLSEDIVDANLENEYDHKLS